MDGVSAGAACRGKKRWDVEVRFAGSRRPDRNRLIRRADMQRVAVEIGVDGNGFDAHGPTTAHDAQGNLAAIGNEDAPEHGLLAARVLRKREYIAIGVFKPGNFRSPGRVPDAQLVLSHAGKALEDYSLLGELRNDLVDGLNLPAQD